MMRYVFEGEVLFHGLFGDEGIASAINEGDWATDIFEVGRFG
jgi:hypothetical protein